MSESTDPKSRFFASSSNFDFLTLDYKLGEKILSKSEFFAESSLLFRIFIGFSDFLNLKFLNFLKHAISESTDP